MALAAGIYSRWNDASLDTSIAKLFRGNWSLMGVDSTPESDGNKDLPRASFGLGPDTVYEDAIEYSIRIAELRFKVWHTDLVALEGFLDTIESNMNDADRAGTNPLVISEGTVMDVRFEGREAYKAPDKNVYAGYVDFTLMWKKARTTPA